MAIASNKGWTPGQEWKGFNWQNPGGAATDPTAYSATPSPQSGTNAFGAVPGSLGIPNPAADLSAQVPGLSGLNQGASDLISDELTGGLSPETLNALRNSNASWAAASGMPGSPFSYNRLFGNVINASEDRRRRGLEDYNRTIPTISGTQTVSPALKTQIASENALNAAAPNPRARANYSESHAADLFNKYLENIRGPGGGTGGYGGPSSGTVPRGTNPFSTSLPTSDYPTSGQVDQAQWQNDPFAADFEAAAVPGFYADSGRRMEFIWL